MKPSLIIFSLAFPRISLVVADKLALCKEICWIHGYFDMDTDCHNSCLASPDPDDSKVLLTEQCVIDCTEKFMSPTVDMRGYTGCRSGCYDEALGPFINRYKSGIFKRNLTPIAPLEGMEDCITRCQRENPQLEGDSPASTCGNYCKIVMQDRFDPETSIKTRPSVVAPQSAARKPIISNKDTGTVASSTSSTPSEDPLESMGENPSVAVVPGMNLANANAHNKSLTLAANGTNATDGTNSTSSELPIRPSPIGEVNGALSWAESAYRSFWFFAWTSLAIAIAIGTQML